jgi:hypothetical protein
MARAAHDGVAVIERTVASTTLRANFLARAVAATVRGFVA